MDRLQIHIESYLKDIHGLVKVISIQMSDIKKKASEIICVTARARDLASPHLIWRTRSCANDVLFPELVRLFYRMHSSHHQLYYADVKARKWHSYMQGLYQWENDIENG